MDKRIAFVGLSGPMFYDYKNAAPTTVAERSSSPNPVLDSPFGLMLLFDEIWFLTRSLCPANMRELPYVRFLDETSLLPRVDDIDVQSLATEVRAAGAQERLADFERQWPQYWDYVRNVGIDWDAAPDNHTHQLRIGGADLSASSRRPELIAFDLEVLNRLAKPNVELVTNSFTQPWIEHPQNPLLQAKLSELLIIENIPSYQSAAGPYHPCIDEAREDRYLAEFRRWIISTHANVQEAELQEIKLAVATSIQKAQDELFLKYLSGRTQAVSAGRSIIGAIVDVAMPGLSTVATIADEISTYFARRDTKWQGFIVSSRKLRSDQ